MLTTPVRTSRPELVPLIAGIRAAVGRGDGWQETATAVGDELRRNLPTADALTAAERLGDPDRYMSHLLHAEPDGSFSIVGLVWRPGQMTPIHDHVTWCVFGVVQGVEYEELYAVETGDYAGATGEESTGEESTGEESTGEESTGAAGGGSGEYLVKVGDNANRTGEVSYFAPPGDIHRVRNSGDRTAISIHVYGTDISRIGSSVRRVYDLPVR